MPRVASSPPAETLSLERHGKFLSGYTNERVFFTYFECPNCSARFCPTYYRQSQLDGLYGRQAENMVSVPLSARKRTQDDYINLLRRHTRMAGNFLEIGPDIGLFASAFAKGGSFEHFWLYEPNREVHPALAANFQGFSHTISADLFRASDVPAESVSTAVMIHVLDHLLEPANFLREIRASLEPGGILFIVTHGAGTGPGAPMAALYAAASATVLATLDRDAAADQRLRGGRDRQDHELFPIAVFDARRTDGVRTARAPRPRGIGTAARTETGQHRHHRAQTQGKPRSVRHTAREGSARA